MTLFQTLEEAYEYHFLCRKKKVSYKTMYLGMQVKLQNELFSKP